MSENERQSQTKLQGTVVTYLGCGEMFNNQVTKGLLLSLSVKKVLKSVNIWHSYGQKDTVDCVVHFLLLLAVWWPSAQVHETTTFLLVTLPKFTDFKNFTGRLSNKPFLIWLLTDPPHLKYVATLPCNVSLIPCFLTLMFHKVVWQHVLGMMGFLVTILLQIYQRISQ